MLRLARRSNIGTGVSLAKIRRWYSDDAPQEGTTETPTPIDWSKISPSDIPEEIVRKNPVYVKVLDESIERRKEIAALKKNTAAPKEESANEENPILSALKQVQEELAALKQLRDQDTKVSVRERVKAEFKLADDDMEFITGDTYEALSDKARKYVAKTVTQASAAANGTEATKKALHERMLELAKAGDMAVRQDVFDTNAHLKSGGGYDS